MGKTKGMYNTIFQEIKKELQKGLAKKGHPFRFCTLGTVGLGNIPRLRTVVLRNVTEDVVLSFYTDKRSKKITHIQENKNVSLLFYHPKKMVQLRIEGTATMDTSQKTTKMIWDGLHPNAKKDYTTVQSPGSAIKDPNHVEYLSDENYFCLVEVLPFKMEYLKLQSPHHLRVRFSNKNGTWESDYLIP